MKTQPINFEALRKLKGPVPAKVVQKILGKHGSTLWRYEAKGMLPPHFCILGGKYYDGEQLKRRLLGAP